ncbi:MAG: response regulator transcription factor [Bacteriovoracaceae bacterium]
MSTRSLLIIEDDNKLRKTLKLEFEERGYCVDEADSIGTIPEKKYHYSIIDMRLNGQSGLKAIQTVKEHSPQCRIIAITGYGSITTAVEAIKLGASDYLTKPIDIEKLEQALHGNKVTSEETLGPLSLSQKEHEYIEYMLIQNDGNIAKTAKALGLHRQSLQRKLKKKP